MAFKLNTIGGFKAVKNDPTTVAKVDLIQGQAVVLDNQAGEAKLPLLAEAQGKGLHFVANIDVHPEIVFAKNEVEVAAGEHVRGFEVASLVGLPVELGGMALKDEVRAKGDKLVAGLDGKWEKKADVAGYALYLEVIELNTYRGKGVVAIVRAA